MERRKGGVEYGLKTTSQENFDQKMPKKVQTDTRLIRYLFLGYAANCRVKRENEEKKLERENENVCI